jgi:hypothetical protein
MNEGTRSGKSTICLLGISAERPTNGLYLTLHLRLKIFKLELSKKVKKSGRVCRTYRGLV